MTSDDSPSAALGRLADVLARASGSRPTATELAELLWLAGHTRPQQAADTGVPPPPAPTRPVSTPAPESPAHVEPDGTAASDAPDRAALHTVGRHGDGPAGSRSHTSLLTPAPPMLAHPLPLQRALRPLKRSVAAPAGWELDEERTADRIARLGADPGVWVPVLRPAAERWLDLHLVFDSGPTMPIWRPLLRDLHRAVAQTGVFRGVRLWLLDAGGTLRPQRRRPGGGCAARPETPPIRPGRTVTLLISDCMGPLWRDGAAGRRWYRMLHRWAAAMPVAIVQPLPERLWRRTALTPVPGQLAASGPGTPNSTLAFTPYGPGPLGGGGGIPVPVLEPSAHWLAHWSAMLAGSGGVARPGTVAYVRAAPPDSLADGERADDFGQLSPQELVLRFRSVASPEAFRLAGHVAVGEPLLPVMRLVHSAIEQRPQTQQLAEVILSGMLQATGEGPGHYAFRPGVRDVLLRTLPRSALGHTAHLLSRVSMEIEARAGSVPGEFQALVRTRRGAGSTDAEPGPDAFALVSPECVRLLRGPSGVAASAGTGRRPSGPARSVPPATGRLVGGRYRLLAPIEAGRYRQVWRAVDERLDRLVAVKLYSAPSDLSPAAHLTLRDRFQVEARSLRRLRHIGLVAVLDLGYDEDGCHLVMELIEGRDLRRSLGAGLPLELVMHTARQVASALEYLHGNGFVHGAVNPKNILVGGDGRILLCDFGPAWPVAASEPTDPPAPESDLHSLGRVLYEMTTGVPPFAPIQERRPPGELRPDVSQELERLILDLLAEEPATRPTAAEVLRRLEPRRRGRPLRFEVLGPIQVFRETESLAVGSPQQRALLVALLFKRGRAATADELIEALWGDRPPEAGIAALRTYATRLGRSLGPGALIPGPEDGYVLPLDGCEVDLWDCERTVEEAKKARSAGDEETSRDLLRKALRYWRGEPLAAIPGPFAERERARLIEWHRTLRTPQSANPDAGTAATTPAGRAAVDSRTAGHIIGLSIDDYGDLTVGERQAVSESFGTVLLWLDALISATGIHCHVEDREHGELFLVETGHMSEAWLLAVLAEQLPVALADAQPSPESGDPPLRLRVALHTGEVENAGGAMTGPAVSAVDGMLSHPMPAGPVCSRLCVSEPVRQRTEEDAESPLVEYDTDARVGDLLWSCHALDAHPSGGPDPDPYDLAEPRADEVPDYEDSLEYALWSAVESACQELVGAEVVRPNAYYVLANGPNLSRVHLPDEFDRATIRDLTVDESGLDWTAYDTYEGGLVLAEVTVHACVTFEGFANRDDAGEWTSIDQDAVLVFSARMESVTLTVSLEFKGTLGPGQSRSNSD